MNYQIEYYKKEHAENKMELLKIMVEIMKSNKIIRIWSGWNNQK